MDAIPANLTDASSIVTGGSYCSVALDIAGFHLTQFSCPAEVAMATLTTAISMYAVLETNLYCGQGHYVLQINNILCTKYQVVMDIRR